MEGVRTTTPTMNKFKLTYEERKVLIAYAKSNMKTSIVSKILQMSISSVNNHIQKIAKKTGVDPGDFFGLACLLNARCIYQENACFIVYDGGNERIEFKGEQ